MNERLKVVIKNIIQDIPKLQDSISSFLRLNSVIQGTIDTVNLIIDELVANIIRWAFVDGKEHEISVEIIFEHRHIRILLEDDGREFDPTGVAQPDVLLPVEERQEGGLGIHLVRNLVDSLTYQRSQGKNNLTIEMKCETSS